MSGVGDATLNPTCRGAYPSARDPNGATPLLGVRFKGHVAIAQALLVGDAGS